MHFFQFCSCGPEGYAHLKACTDSCARVGRSYEFRRCRMPAGCLPEEADLGFWRSDDGYLLYFRPRLTYLGGCRALADFFGRGPLHCFPSFGALAAALDNLGRAWAWEAAQRGDAFVLVFPVQDSRPGRPQP